MISLFTPFTYNMQSTNGHGIYGLSSFLADDHTLTVTEDLNLLKLYCTFIAGNISSIFSGANVSELLEKIA